MVGIRIIKRKYCGGEKEEMKKVPVLSIENMKKGGIFSNAENRNNLIDYWKNKEFINPGKNKKVIEMGEKNKKILIENNTVKKKVVIEEEKKEEMKEIPQIGQYLITKLVEKNIGNAEERTKKQNAQKIKGVSQEQVGGSKEYLISTILQIATLIYNSQGGALAVATGIYKLWASSSQAQKDLSIKAGIGAVMYVAKKPWNWFCSVLGKNKWKITSGGVGGELGLEITKKLNEEGIAIVSLDNGKNMLVNENVKQVIQTNIDRMVENGVNVTTPMVETMLREGKAIDLTRSTLEPLIRGFSPEKQAEIMELNIFGNEIATKHINLEQVPNMLQKSVNGVEGVINYTNQIIGAEGPIGGGYTWFNLIFGLVIIGGSIYAGKEILNAINSDQSEGLIKETGKVFWGIKDKITGILFSLTGLGFVYKAQQEIKQQKELSPEEKSKKELLDEINGDDDDLV